MFNKKIILMLTLILVSLLGVSAVSAEDNVTSDIVNVENEINGDFSFGSDVDSENLKTTDLEEKNINQLNYSKDFDNILGDGNESDKISAKIIPINLEAEYASGTFTFKLVDVDTNEGLVNKKLSYTLLRDDINTGGFVITDEKGIATMDNSNLYFYKFEDGNITSGGNIKVGKQLFSIKGNDSSISAPEIKDNFTVVQAKINIRLNPYEECYGSSKKLVIKATNAKTGTPMKGIVLHLSLVNTAVEDYYLKTDSNGTVEFNASNLNSGKYSLTVSNNDTENMKSKSVRGNITILPVSYDKNKEKIEIIVDDLDLYYSTAYSYIVSLVDEYGDSIYDVEELKVTYDDGDEEIGEYDDEGYYLFSMDKIANRKATLTLTDPYYWAYPVTINVKISKSPVKITTKNYYSNTKQYSILKAIVKDTDGEPIAEGKVKFDINGKSYYVNVENGVATKKIKLTKAKTYTYSATYIGNDHYKDSKTASSKIYVYSSSKKARTLNIKGYKVTLTQNQYNNLIKAKNTGKTISYTLNTHKKVKQTITSNYKNFKTIKAPVYITISYGGKEPKRQQQYPNKYSIFAETKYTAYATKGKLILTKDASTINGLKNAKVTDMSHFSMR